MELETLLINLIPIITAACTVISFIAGRSTATKKRGEAEGALKSDIEYIKTRLDSLYEEQKSILHTVESHAETIVRTEASAQQAHKRINGLETRINSVQR